MRLNAALTAIGLAVTFAQAHAAAPDDYPSRPIRMIIPNTPGSTTDIFGRMLFQRMSDKLGQQIVVDNRPGAGGVPAMETAARAAPNGYTLVAVAASNMTIAPHTYRKIGYDPLKDYAPISLFVTAQTALCVNAGLPAKNVREFIDLARAKPRELNMASAGVGATSHLGGLLFVTMANIEVNHVPYKGGGPSMLAVAQGEAQWTLGPVSAAMNHVKSGRMRCLATGGEKRSVTTPDLPTISESGVPGFRYYGWNGVLAPAALPKPMVDRLNAVMRDGLADPDLRRLYLQLGDEPSYTTPADMDKLIREEYATMGKLVKMAGVRAD